MRRHLCIAALALFAAGSPGCGKQSETETPTHGTLALRATESHLALFTQEADEFHRLYTDAVVNVSGTSTRDAIVQLLNGRTTAAAIDRDLNDEERAVAKKAGLEVTTLRVAEDALGVLVNRRNQVSEFTMGTLDSLFHQRLRRWDRIAGSGLQGPIELAVTGRNSGAFELLARRFFPGGPDPEPALVATTEKEVGEYVAAHPGALGWVSIGGLPDSTATARAVPVVAAGLDSVIAPQKLHQANVYRGFYPLHYPVYLAYVGSSSSVAVGFGAFVSSAAGQKIILNAGLVPATMPVRLVQVTRE